MSEKLNSVWWTLRIGIGLGAFLAGLDKFFNVLTDWSMYLSPLAERMLPVSAPVFMRAVGVIEMLAGALLLAGFARVGGYIVMGWLLAIAANLVSTGMFLDLAVRDVEIALAAYALARLTEVRMASRIATVREVERRATSGPDLERSRLRKRIAVMTVVSVLTVPITVAADTWTNPDSHTTQCALQCVKGGYGLIDAKGTFLKFDAAGNEKIVAALKATKKTDHLRATVTGERDGDTIKVSSVSIE
jgi:uncharacterized membrane protein YphA (DoxX/SURF4 family)